ncbi:MAG TPA: alpha/beta fold hydrolase, partial [Burkholderiaceae bacterium]|nr:alpha/beta fold hydrolase [Burkholderiaceae bacterium]
YPQRCRRLVLAATAAGGLMVPGKLSVLSKMASPRRYTDADYMAEIGGELYGGALRHRPELLREHAHHMRAPRGRGYYYQQLAMLGWTSVFGLPLLRQPTLVIAGSDDPIVPLVNAKILAALIPKAKLHVVDDGHLFLVSRTDEIAELVRGFLAAKA